MPNGRLGRRRGRTRCFERATDRDRGGRYWADETGRVKQRLKAARVAVEGRGRRAGTDLAELLDATPEGAGVVEVLHTAGEHRGMPPLADPGIAPGRRAHASGQGGDTDAGAGPQQ